MEAKDVYTAFSRANEAFKFECFLHGDTYSPCTEPLLSGLSFDSLRVASPRMFESLVIELCSLEEEKLKEWYMAAMRAGHRDHLYLPGMGHVHRSMLLLLHRKAIEYFDSL